MRARRPRRVAALALVAPYSPSRLLLPCWLPHARRRVAATWFRRFQTGGRLVQCVASPSTTSAATLPVALRPPDWRSLQGARWRGW